MRMNEHPSSGDGMVAGKSTGTDWRSHLLTTPEAIGALIARTRRIAVIGIKPESAGGPAWGVPAFLAGRGFAIVPVPVYYPELTTLLGEPVHRSLATVPGPIDLVQLFRRPVDVPRHLDELLAARPRAVWMQLGIREDRVAEALARAGIDVVQDHCLKVELLARDA
jgi:predicted CoA-binding protein